MVPCTMIALHLNTLCISSWLEKYVIFDIQLEKYFARILFDILSVMQYISNVFYLYTSASKWTPSIIYIWCQPVYIMCHCTDLGTLYISMLNEDIQQARHPSHYTCTISLLLPPWRCRVYRNLWMLECLGILPYNRSTLETLPNSVLV